MLIQNSFNLRCAKVFLLQFIKQYLMKKKYAIVILLFCAFNIQKNSAQTLNFTIDTATDNGGDITEVLTESTDTYTLKAEHPNGVANLDDVGVGDQVFFTVVDSQFRPWVITITKNSDPTPVAFTFTSVDYDSVGSGDITLSNQSNAIITPSASYNGTGTILVTNTVNAANIEALRITPGGADDLNDIGFHNIQVTITPPNNAPTAIAPSIPMILEDGANTTLADDIQVMDADGDDQTLSFTITGGTLTLGTSGITFGGDGNGSSSFTAQGSLVEVNTALDAATFTPTPNLNGTDAGIIAFTTNDGEATSTLAGVTFNITAVNDAPSFVAGANQTVEEDVTEQTVNGWATALDAGAPNESGQNLSFAVTNDANALFSIQPAIDAMGNLTYTPTTGVNGLATVSVVLSDDGGASNGGDDTFETQEFTITVNNAALSTTDVLAQSAFTFSNPVKTVFKVTSATTNITAITVYSLSGTKLMTSTSPVLNMAHLASGLYLVSIKTDSDTWATVKVIKE